MKSNKSELNLHGFSLLLSTASEGYEALYGGALKFGHFGRFELTPKKPYSARTEGPVIYHGNNIGDMTVIVLRPGDGTGDDKTFKLDELEIPEHLRFDEKPERVLPRSKSKVQYELFFPFFSWSETRFHIFAASLEEITVKDGRIEKAWDLGLNPDAYKRVIEKNITGVPPQVYLTTGYRQDGKRFGDPHAIYHGIPHAVHHGIDLDMYQVVGFLGIKNGNRLLNLADSGIQPE